MACEKSKNPTIDTYNNPNPFITHVLIVHAAHNLSILSSGARNPWATYNGGIDIPNPANHASKHTIQFVHLHTLQVSMGSHLLNHSLPQCQLLRKSDTHTELVQPSWLSECPNTSWACKLHYLRHQQPQ